MAKAHFFSHEAERDPVRELEKTAATLREDVIEMLTAAGSGHVVGALSFADVVAVLYFYLLKINPNDPFWPERDRVVISNGHICPVVYAAMARRGFFSLKELKTFRQLNSRLQGFPSHTDLSGVEATTGILGQGLSQAVGMALTGMQIGKNWRVYCLLSEGDHNEGQTWEAAMLAAKYKLHNLTVFIDRNHVQFDGLTEQIMPLEPLVDKYKAFNWHVIQTDGHNICHLIDAANEASSVLEQPQAIICHTQPGKNIPLDDLKEFQRGLAPNAVQAHKAVNILRTLKGRIESELQ